jgi:hypothetical protein
MEPPDFYPWHDMEPGDFYPSPPSGCSATLSVIRLGKSGRRVLTFYEEHPELSDEAWRLLLKRALEGQQNE